MSDELSKQIIDEKVITFIKHTYDTYNNPHKMCKYLGEEFERKGLMCGFTWIPADQYFGDINVVFISTTDIWDRKSKIIRSPKSRDLLSRKMTLSEFIFNIYNPEGVFILEKVQFILEG